MTRVDPVLGPGAPRPRGAERPPGPRVPAGLAGTGVLALLVWLAARPLRVQVVGASMLPTLEEGDRALALRAWRVRPGAVVVLSDPRGTQRRLVKRVCWIGLDGSGRRAVWVEGDNPAASTDSRVLGLVPLSALRGVVVWRYAPPARTGRLDRPPGPAPRQVSRRRSGRPAAPPG